MGTSRGGVIGYLGAARYGGSRKSCSRYEIDVPPIRAPLENLTYSVCGGYLLRPSPCHITQARKYGASECIFYHSFLNHLAKAKHTLGKVPAERVPVYSECA